MMDYSTEIGSTFVPLDDTPEDVLAENISHFFMILRKKDGSFYNASSLGTFYQSLSHHLSKKEPPIDIKNDIWFRYVQDIVSIKCTESAEGGECPGKHAANSIEPAAASQNYGTYHYDPQSTYATQVVSSSTYQQEAVDSTWIDDFDFGLL